MKNLLHIGESAKIELVFWLLKFDPNMVTSKNVMKMELHIENF